MIDKKVMVYSKSTLGKLLYGTISDMSNNSITLTDCVEIDFLDHIDNPNIGILANDVDSLRKCVISSTISCITSFEVVFIFFCSQAVHEYLDTIR